MTTPPTMDRRRFLSLAGQTALAGSLGVFGSQARAATPAHHLTVGSRTIEVQGKAARVFGITDAAGRSGLTLDRADGFDVRLTNATTDPTVIHWHGLTPPFDFDGNMLSQAPISPGASQDYRFDLARTGTNWMHSHMGLQEAHLMAAPLILRDGPADRQEVVMLLHDFSFTPPEELLAQLTRGDADPVGSGTAAMKNGMMRMPLKEAGGTMAGMAGMKDMAGMAPATETAPMQGMAGMDHSSMMMPMGDMAPAADGAPMDGMDHGSMTMDGSMQMDLNDIPFDAFLANDRDLSDPEIVQVDRGGRVRLRIINAASSTNFWIDLGAMSGVLTAVDGMPIEPLSGRLFEVAMAQRLDIDMQMPDAATAIPILAQREGDDMRTGIVLATAGAKIGRVDPKAAQKAPALSFDLERRLVAAGPLESRTPDRRIACDLTGDMAAYVWGIDGRSYANRKPLEVSKGERVEITMTNRTMMSHPMHLHGHHFQVVGLGRAKFAGAMRDTVLVPAMDSVTIAFDADNPGDWPFHCHNLYHMAAGMMTTVRYV